MRDSQARACPPCKPSNALICPLDATVPLFVGLPFFAAAGDNCRSFNLPSHYLSVLKPVLQSIDRWHVTSSRIDSKARVKGARSPSAANCGGRRLRFGDPKLNVNEVELPLGVAQMDGRTRDLCAGEIRRKPGTSSGPSRTKRLRWSAFFKGWPARSFFRVSSNGSGRV